MAMLGFQSPIGSSFHHLRPWKIRQLSGSTKSAQFNRWCSEKWSYNWPWHGRILKGFTRLQQWDFCLSFLMVEATDGSFPLSTKSGNAKGAAAFGHQIYGSPTTVLEGLWSSYTRVTLGYIMAMNHINQLYLSKTSEWFTRIGFWLSCSQFHLFGPTHLTPSMGMHHANLRNKGRFGSHNTSHNGLWPTWKTHDQSPKLERWP